VHLRRVAPHEITATLSLFAAQDSRPFEVQQDRLQEFLGNTTSIGNILDEKFLMRFLSHVYECVDGVFTLLGDHSGATIYKIVTRLLSLIRISPLPLSSYKGQPKKSYRLPPALCDFGRNPYIYRR